VVVVAVDQIVGSIVIVDRFVILGQIVDIYADRGRYRIVIDDAAVIVREVVTIVVPVVIPPSPADRPAAMRQMSISSASIAIVTIWIAAS